MDWFTSSSTALWIMGAVSVALFVASLFAVRLLVVRLPADYFTRSDEPLTSRGRFEKSTAAVILVVRNLVGILILFAGLVMMVTPGPGLVTIIIGLSLMSFPAKRRLILRVVRQPRVLGWINGLRAKHNKPPLQVPEVDRQV